MDSQKTKTLGIVLILFLLLLFYKCPIQSVTGLPCPGCNMKTSLYYLLHFKFSLSLYYHALLIPTLIVFVVVLMNLNKPERIKKLLIIWAIFMIVYYIYRMIVYFPNSPMIYSKENLIYFIFRHVYDKEAISVNLAGLGKIGYVANSPYTVLGESYSAGRLYD